MYVVIFNNNDEIEVRYIFKTYKEAREYIEEEINSRNDLFDDCDDVVVFDNDDTFYIEKVTWYKGK